VYYDSIKYSKLQLKGLPACLKGRQDFGIFAGYFQNSPARSSRPGRYYDPIKYSKLQLKETCQVLKTLQDNLRNSCNF